MIYTSPRAVLAWSATQSPLFGGFLLCWTLVSHRCEGFSMVWEFLSHFFLDLKFFGCG